MKLAINESFRIIQLLRCYHRIIVVRWRGNRPRRYSVGNSETRHAKAWRRAARIDAPTVGISPAPASQPEYSPHPEIPMRKSQDRTREGALPSLTLRPRTRRTLSARSNSTRVDRENIRFLGTARPWLPGTSSNEKESSTLGSGIGKTFGNCQTYDNFNF